MTFKDNLYNGLMKICEPEGAPFFFEDTKLNDSFSYRVFCYTIPKSSQYKQPYAKESRGTMFLIDNVTKSPVDLVVLPMPKFFTFGENQETIGLDLKTAKRVTLKADGSLLSTYIDLQGELQFKTKRKPKQKSFDDILKHVLYEEFKNELFNLTKCHTVDCELTSPDNRVILSYDKPELHILKVRDRSNGNFIDIHNDEFKKEFPHVAKHIIKTYDISILDDILDKDSILDIKNIEGVVVEMPDGTMTKVKTPYYLTQNKFANIQDFKKRNQLMVEACIEETFDELRTLFHYRNRSPNYDIEGILSAMDSIEEQVNATYPKFIDSINSFIKDHEELSLDEFKDKVLSSDLKPYIGILMPMKRGVYMNLKTAYMNAIGKKLKA